MFALALSVFVLFVLFRMTDFIKNKKSEKAHHCLYGIRIFTAGFFPALLFGEIYIWTDKVYGIFFALAFLGWIIAVIGVIYYNILFFAYLFSDDE